MKRALILGVGGMDGSHLADLLLEKNYEVHGLARRSSVDNLARVAYVRDRVTVHRGDLADATSVYRALLASSPWEIYNMADQDDVGWSADAPLYSWQVTCGGPATILEYMRQHEKDGARFFQPISSTVFGDTPAPQSEDSPLAPKSPYACAKAAAWLLCKHYRREHGVFVSCGVFFNHTSPRQKETYLLPTIARQAVEVARGTRERIELTGPDVLLDVGRAKEYVAAAWKVLQQYRPDDFCIGTGRPYRVSDYCRVALRKAGVSADRFFLTNADSPAHRHSAVVERVRTLEWWANYDGCGAVGELVDYYSEQP